MSSWMKRRIHRSRARCHKALLTNKEKVRHEQSEDRRSKKNAATPHADSRPASDK
jgi:hypothetical protein